METLTLPGPAGRLWAAKRDVIHRLPAEPFGRPIRPHLGGGTTLAARWEHRLSKVALDGAQLTVRKTIAGGPLNAEQYDAVDAPGALIRSGIAAHLNSNGPISAPQLLAVIRTAAARRPSFTVYDSADSESAGHVRKAAEPARGSTRPRRPDGERG